MHPSGLGQFFDSLDEDIKFESWKNTIKGKLTHLKKTIPNEIVTGKHIITFIK